MNFILSHIARISIYLIGLLPLSAARGLGVALGTLSWRLKDRGLRITQDNLRLCFPDRDESQRVELARASLKETYKIAGETFVLWRRGSEWARKVTLTKRGEELLTEPLKCGHGVLLAMPHLGNWELFGSHLAAYAKTTCMYQPPKQSSLDTIILENRRNLGVTMVPTNRRGVAAELKALKAGELVGILPDQVPADESGIFSPFFGVEAYTMTLIHGLIQRTGCKVIMGFAKRVSGGFELHFLEPPEDIYSENEASSVRALNKAVEECVSVCEEQYQWEYKRFKKTRKGEADRYTC